MIVTRPYKLDASNGKPLTVAEDCVLVSLMLTVVSSGVLAYDVVIGFAPDGGDINPIFTTQFNSPAAGGSLYLSQPMRIPLKKGQNIYMTDVGGDTEIAMFYCEVSI